MSLAFGASRQVSSPDGRITVGVHTDKKGELFYSVTRDGTDILLPSRLGICLKDAPDMADGFKIEKCSFSKGDEVWNPVWGEESEITDRHNEMRLTLSQKKVAQGRKISVVFRVFDDGVGFRYEFPRQKSLGDFVIADELTEFDFAGNHESWSLPVEGIRFYEGLFRKLPIDSIGWASTPVTIRTADGTHMALHEANLTDYAAMNVKRYTDFASGHSFGGVLVEGWNHDWVTWDFSFTKPYDDFETNYYFRR